MPSPPKLAALCDAFPLGAPVSPLERVAGGLSNDLWRLDTSTGSFAVKRMVAHADSPGFASNVEAAYAVERRATERGIAAPRPVPVKGDERCLEALECDDGSPAWVRVHEWVEGRTPDHREIGAEHASQLGVVLGSLHALRIDARTLERGAVRAIGREGWRAIYARCAAHPAPWSSGIAHLAAPTLALDARVEAEADESTEVVCGHRDCDDKNTLLTPANGLLLIDWDAAGATVAAHELAAALLDWTGARHASPRAGIAAAIVSGYRRANPGAAAIARRDTVGWLSGNLGWLHFNLERALGDHGPGEIALGEHEVAYFLEHLPRIERSLDAWADGWGAL